MGVILNQILPILDAVAPASWAQSWDNVGLQLGDPDAGIRKILICLDIVPSVINEAAESGAQLIISHHPLFFKPLSRLNFRSSTANLIRRLIKAELNVYTAHTNLDAAPDGVNDVLADIIGLDNKEVLSSQKEELYKVVVFVPEEDALRVYDAMTRAGAGNIGSYSHCSFWQKGIGTFKPNASAKPYIGDNDKINRVSEIRIESIINKQKLSSVMRAIYRVHPYEEVACDIYPVKTWGKLCGIGRIGILNSAVSLEKLSLDLKKKLSLPALILVGNKKQMIKRVAVCSGSGGDFITQAKTAGAQVLVTGDIKYHQAMLAQAQKLAIIDVGHYYSELPIVDKLTKKLTKCFKEANLSVEVIAAHSQADPFCFISDEGYVSESESGNTN